MTRIGRGSGRSRRGGLRISLVRRWGTLPFKRRRELVRVERGRGRGRRTYGVHPDYDDPYEHCEEEPGCPCCCAEPCEDVGYHYRHNGHPLYDMEHQNQGVQGTSIRTNKSHTRPSASSASDNRLSTSTLEKDQRQ